MKLFLHVFVAFIFSHFSFSQPPLVLDWVAHIEGSTQRNRISDMKLDALGNVYIVGSFNGQANQMVDFDPGPNIVELDSIGSLDIFIQKLNPQGSFVWAKSIGSNMYDDGLSLALDSDGNVYTTGFFEGTADFNPGMEISNLTSNGNSDVFIQKWDNDGNFIWAKNIGFSGYDEAYSLTLDNQKNIYITGYFEETVDFDPGPETFTLNSEGETDIFVQKLDPDGNFLWAKSMGSTNYEEGSFITLDTYGNVYTTGYFEGNVDFDAGAVTLSSLGGTDIFIQKMDNDGNFEWAKSIGSSSNEESYSITTDSQGNVYTTGYFEGTADFDPGSGTFNLTSNGNSDIFIQKMDADGNFVWAKHIGSNGIDRGVSLTLDDQEDLYITGGFEGTTDFNPGFEIFNLTSQGIQDIFICKLDSDGNFVWAESLGSTEFDIGFVINIDSQGNIFSAGTFEGTLDFDPGSASVEKTPSTNSSDIFVVKLSPNPLNIISVQEKQNLFYPNPTEALLFSNDSSKIMNFKIYDITGRQVLSGSTDKNIDVSFLKKGVYLIRANEHIQKIVKK